MAAQPGVFVLKEDEALVPMQPTQFAAELDFQKLLSKFPSLLVGDQIDPDNPKRFILIRQELSIGHELRPWADPPPQLPSRMTIERRRMRNEPITLANTHPDDIAAFDRCSASMAR
ncbi:hypothetical protein [Methylorubrum populi]|uniref:hypothetical protein n=1 Tax=Methylorubrum populi TaxID=223967 RepID=UPI003F65DB85